MFTTKIQSTAIAFICASIFSQNAYTSSDLKEELIANSFKTSSQEKIVIDINNEQNENSLLIKKPSTQTTYFKTLAGYVNPAIKTLSWVSSFGPFLLEVANDVGVEGQIPHIQWLRYAAVTSPVFFRGMSEALDKYLKE